MYLMLGTRRDLIYRVGYLSRSLENPKAQVVIRVKKVLRYIAGTLKNGITYFQNSEVGILQCYSDADAAFGGCVQGGRSTSVVVIMYAGGSISW